MVQYFIAVVNYLFSFQMLVFHMTRKEEDDGYRTCQDCYRYHKLAGQSCFFFS